MNKLKKRNNFSLIFCVLLFILISASFVASSLLDLIFDSSDDIITGFGNMTELNDSNGIRLSAPVLFMDFNSAPETNIDGNITYVQDNSLYNSWGTLK